jgi:hypothetical protein
MSYAMIVEMISQQPFDMSEDGFHSQ